MFSKNNGVFLSERKLRCKSPFPKNRRTRRTWNGSSTEHTSVSIAANKPSAFGSSESAAASVRMARLRLTQRFPLRRGHELQHDLIAVFQREADTVPVALGIGQLRLRRQRNEQALPENRMRQDIPLGGA